MSSITDGASFNSNSAYYATSSGGGGGAVVVGTGQATTGTRTASFWEVGTLLFCAINISTNTATQGLGSFTLPAGYAWTTNNQAQFPQIYCTAVSGTTGGVGPVSLTAVAQANQPGSGVNNVITIQCTDETGTGVPANVNVLAFGVKA